MSPGQHHAGIRSIVGGGEPIRLPDPSSALPPADSFPEAIPKYVSGRTSYLRALLAFHPYPQVIRAVFNPQRFGPPPPVTAASTCSRVDRHGFGSTATYWGRPIQTRFRSASGPEGLKLHVTSNSLRHNAKGTPSADAEPKPAAAFDRL